MQKLHFTILIYISSMCFARDISEQYNQLTKSTSDSSRSTHNEMRSTADSWQPISQRNWIILNSAIKKEATSAAADAAAATVPSYQSNDIYSRLLKSYNSNQEHKEHHGHSHHLPMNYYTYNHTSDGNYLQPTAADVKLIEPYIVTISQMRDRTSSGSDSVLMRRVSQHVVADASLPKDIEVNLVSPQNEKKPDIDDNSDNGKRSNYIESKDTMQTSNLKGNNDITVSLFENIEADGAHLNELFLPLRHTLNKVIYFCDIAKSFISYDNEDEDEDDDDDDDDKENENANDNDPVNDLAPDQVQAHQSISTNPTMVSPLSTSTGRSQPSITQETTALTSVGTGRKIKRLKKKLRKFILPLLLAYKLKFLTLIPVFIGGLILLVGTTGLAGFFFALFTAVMSLKSVGGGKSIVVKKI